MRLAADIRTISHVAPPDDVTDRVADDDARDVALARRDPAAFAPLYERYAQPIYYFCYRRLGNRHDAADATAVTFTRALAALGSFHPDRPGSTFRAWLYTIARNALIDHARSARPHASLDHPDAPDLVDRAPSPEDHALGAEAARAVDRLLRRLPERQRAVVELRLAGLRIAEIATALGVTESAAKSLQVRAYRTLRDLVDTDPTSLTRERRP